MKKITALAFVLLLATTVSSFADTQAPSATDEGKSIYGRIDQDPASTTDAAATLIGKLSKGVYASWSSSINGYLLTTQHISGNRSFGSSHAATAIFRNDSVGVDCSAATGANINSSFFGAGWTAM